MVKCLVTKYPKGIYKATFSFGMGGPTLQETHAKNLRYPILYNSELSNPDQIKIVEDAVEQANKEGNFDLEMLESRLSE